MIVLTQQQVKEFQDIWRKEYGEDISEKEAFERGSRLVEFTRRVCMGKARREKATSLLTDKE